jgi:predicted lipoprotein with Yx(FWY)xxD motif
MSGRRARGRAIVAVVGTLTIAVVLAACGSSKSSHLSSATTVAASKPIVMTTADPKLGTILVDSQGHTLYRNTKESNGTIVCTGSCAQLWPPLVLLPGVATPTGGSGVTGRLATVTRPDGSTQVTYDGMPLYRYASDTKPGDTNGQGFGGIWFVVLASGGSPTTTAVSAPTTAAPTATTRAVPTTAATMPHAATTQPPATQAPATQPPTTHAPATVPPTSPPTTQPAPATTTPCLYPPCY